MKIALQILCLLLSTAALGQGQGAPGSIYSEFGRFSDLVSDLRARRVGDPITIVVSDRLTAVSQGDTSSNRTSSANSSISKLLGLPAPLGALNNLTTLSGSQTLDGSGSTSRSNVLTTTLTGRVVEVLPNGDLVVQATKEVGVNSERHVIALRGIVRWNDVSLNNQVRSDRLAMMSIQLNGKGLVSDAIRRPNLIYRILLGILPF